MPSGAYVYCAHSLFAKCSIKIMCEMIVKIEMKKQLLRGIRFASEVDDSAYLL